MAASPLAAIGKMTELRQRILFVLGAMVVFRVGTHIPIPGVDPTAVAALFEQTRGSIVDIFNMFKSYLPLFQSLRPCVVANENIDPIAPINFF